MHTFKRILILIALLILLGLAYMIFPHARMPGVGSHGQESPATSSPSLPSTPSDGTIVCTMDAKMCPDGTYVGRTGPTCEFVCPARSPSVPGAPIVGTSTLTLGADGVGSIDGLIFSPLKVEQDSRCPMGVMCIQAGTVTVTVKFYEKDVLDSARVLELGKPSVVGAHQVTLTAVEPPRRAGVEIGGLQYRFTFEVKSLQ